MPTLAEHRLLRIVVLCALYVAQGIPYGFLTVTLAVALAADGLEAGEIGGIFALGTLPWAFKWVWGPFVDRFGSTRFGRRRPWILAAQTGMVGSLVVMWAIPSPSTELTLLGGLVVFHNIFNSLQDVCVDALAVDLLPPEDRGKASGLMYGSKYVGTAIGGGGLSIVADFGGLSSAFGVMVLLVAAIALFPLLTVERPGDLAWPGGPSGVGRRNPFTDDSDTPVEPDRPTPSVLQLLRDLAAAFGSRAAIATALVALLATSASGMLSPIGAVYFVQELGWTQAEYGAASGGAATFAGLFGAVIGGFLADLLGPRRLVAASSVLLAVVLGSFGLGLGTEAFTDRPLLWAYLVVEAGLLGCINAAFFAICFGVSRPAVAATQFTAYMALMNLGMTGAQALAGPVETLLSVRGAWLLAAGVQLLVALMLPLTMINRPSRTQKRASSV